MSKVHGLILAGGHGSRLGHVRKADLRLGGMRLIERVAARLSGVARPVLISTGFGETVTLENALCLPDGMGDKQGPMAGLVAGVRHQLPQAEPDDVLICVAVDTPFLPDDFVARMIAALADGAAASHAVFGETLYPTNAAYRLSALADLPRQFDSGAAPNSPRRLLDLLGAVKIDWSGAVSGDPFANLNTLEDLVRLSRRCAIAN